MTTDPPIATTSSPTCKSAPETLPALASAAADGDVAAFERLHARLGAGLRRFLAQRSGGSVEEAEDLAQRTWASVWLALRQGRYDPAKAAISTFLYAVGYRTWIQEARTQSRNASRMDSVDRQAALLFGDHPDPAGALPACELLDAVRDCLKAEGGPDCLTADERHLLQCAAAGEPDRAVAKRLGIAASTVHARRQAAYGKLRRMLAARGFTGTERGGRSRG